MVEKEDDAKPSQLKLITILFWCSPIIVSLIILWVTFMMNWEPWFGYASVIAGCLATISIAGHHFGIDGR